MFTVHCSLFSCHLCDPAAGATGSIVLSRRIGTASFGKCLLRGARVGEHTNQAVVALVAVSLINLILLIAVLLQFLDGRPWPCPCGWILNRDLVGKRIGIDALVPLDQMQILAGIMIFVPLFEIRDVDDERVLFPMSACIDRAHAYNVRQMWSI